MNASVSPADTSRPARSVSSSRTQPWMSPTMWNRPLMSSPSEQLLERRTVFENAQCGAVRIDVAGTDRLEQWSNAVGRAAEPQHRELRLPDPDRLDDHVLHAVRVEEADHVARGTRDAAVAAAAREATDEHARVEEVRLHPDAVAEHRAAAERARRID